MKRWLPKDGKDVRSWVLFIGGLVVVFWQLVMDQVDRPTMLVVGAAMMGFPVFLKRDDPPPPPPAPPAIGVPEVKP